MNGFRFVLMKTFLLRISIMLYVSLCFLIEL
jgi:hypothetical protein